MTVVKSMVDAGAANFDSIVTDPPYGVGSYDWGMPPQMMWQTLLGAVKPGAFMLATGNPKTFHRQMVAIEDAGWLIRDTLIWLFGNSYRYTGEKDAASARWAVHQELMGKRSTIQRGVLHSEAHKWQGFGSRLRPSWEPIILAQHPGEGRMGKDLIEHGVGALNVSQLPSPGQLLLWGKEIGPPRNVVMDEAAADQVAALFGTDKSRFFYCRFPSAAERHAGCEDLKLQNDHPTIKPVAFMRWLVRLVTPYGGTVLDPYCGSGSIGMAAAMEHVQFVGIDLDPHYLEIAQRRISAYRQKALLQTMTEQRRMGSFVKSKIKVSMRISHAQRINSGRSSTCRRGHLLSAENLYTRPDGRTECRICKQLTRKK